ncbi:flavin reductase family protein [Ruixingdingia sedimenti]|uniref:Flavin reductase family protein n=1 Tax=Ruixingdingia sedimenti TaxID=3073604 RepID=A0ABU1F9C1_9RHOB|nr:flavin reductase family protein [Xinfangfangia sp. LG-4]MDR5653480.1 flavin reductase family protein [Xinfangfangia sp. LG-4]
MGVTIGTDPPAFAEKLRQSMRASAISVSLMTTRDEDGSYHGMAVTSANSLSMDPPSMMVAINRTASSHPVLMRSRTFCLNMIHNGQMEMLDLFCHSRMRAARFASPEWRPGLRGLPYLDSAIANLFCRIDESHDYGTHTVFFGRIEDIRISPRLDSTDPLIWINGAPARFEVDPGLHRRGDVVTAGRR